MPVPAAGPSPPGGPAAKRQPQCPSTGASWRPGQLLRRRAMHPGPAVDTGDPARAAAPAATFPRSSIAGGGRSGKQAPWPFSIALRARAIARWVLPTPGGPGSGMLAAPVRRSGGVGACGPGRPQLRRRGPGRAGWRGGPPVCAGGRQHADHPVVAACRLIPGAGGDWWSPGTRPHGAEVPRDDAVSGCRTSPQARARCGRVWGVSRDSPREYGPVHI